MPDIKCLSCRWHIDPTGNCPQGACYSRRVTGGNRQVLPLDTAREICNKEGDGVFVYFEPKTPAAGAAADGAPHGARTLLSASTDASSVDTHAITPAQRPLRRAAGGVI